MYTQHQGLNILSFKSNPIDIQNEKLTPSSLSAKIDITLDCTFLLKEKYAREIADIVPAGT